MTKDELACLKRGDLVRHKHDSRAYVVTTNHGDRVTAVASVEMTNPVEWDRIDLHGRVLTDVAPAEPLADDCKGCGECRVCTASP